MVRTLLLSVIVLVTLSAAEQSADTGFHRSLLGEAPLLFDQHGQRLPAKYTDYLSKRKYVILYFSSSSCIPCQKFNPEFIAWYNANGGGEKFEVILVGTDFTTDSIKDYVKKYKMPWLAIEKTDPKGNVDTNYQRIFDKYGSKYNPTLVLLDENDNVIERSNAGEKYIGTKIVLKKYLELSKKK